MRAATHRTSHQHSRDHVALDETQWAAGGCTYSLSRALATFAAVADFLEVGLVTDWPVVYRTQLLKYTPCHVEP